MQSSSQSCPKCADAGDCSSLGSKGGTVIFGNDRLQCIACGARWPDTHRIEERAGEYGVVPTRAGRVTDPVDMTPNFAGAGPFRSTRAVSLPAPDGFLLLTLVIIAGFLLLQPFSADWRFTLPWHTPGGIEISALKTNQSQQGGNVSLQVEGRITNNDSVRREIGDVIIVLKQAAGHPVFSWKHRPALDYLNPGQSIRFKSLSSTVPDFASQVEVTAAGNATTAGLGSKVATAQW